MMLKPSDSISIIDCTLKDFNTNFNKNDDKFLSFTYGWQDDIAIIRKFDINGIFIISFRKTISQFMFSH